MPTTAAVLNQKGGSGKTTIATNLAYALKRDGSRVLLVDADQHFLKLLTNLEQLWVHYAACPSSGAAEDAILGYFCAHVSEEAKNGLRDSIHPFPYANLEWPQGIRKDHGIRHPVNPERRETKTWWSPLTRHQPRLPNLTLGR